MKCIPAATVLVGAVYAFAADSSLLEPRAILGSEQSEDLDYPAIVSIWWKFPCTGSLVTNEWVLTAAWCLVEDGELTSWVRVEQGQNSRLGRTSVTVATFRDDPVTLHPDYDSESLPESVSSTFPGNLALIRLPHDFRSDHRAEGFGRVIGLETSRVAIPGVEVQFVAHGWNPELTRQTTIQVAKRVIVDCPSEFSGYICTESEGLSPQLPNYDHGGDPGGQLLLPSETGSVSLLGIWNGYDPRDGGVDVFTPISRYYGWITDVVGLDLSAQSLTQRLSIQISSGLDRECRWSLAAEHDGALDFERVLLGASSGPSHVYGGVIHPYSRTPEIKLLRGSSTDVVITVACTQR